VGTPGRRGQRPGAGGVPSDRLRRRDVPVPEPERAGADAATGRRRGFDPDPGRPARPRRQRRLLRRLRPGRSLGRIPHGLRRRRPGGSAAATGHRGRRLRRDRRLGRAPPRRPGGRRARRERRPAALRRPRRLRQHPALGRTHLRVSAGGVRDRGSGGLLDLADRGERHALRRQRRGAVLVRRPSERPRGQRRWNGRVRLRRRQHLVGRRRRRRTRALSQLVRQPRLRARPAAARPTRPRRARPDRADRAESARRRVGRAPRADRARQPAPERQLQRRGPAARLGRRFRRLPCGRRRLGPARRGRRSGLGLGPADGPDRAGRRERSGRQRAPVRAGRARPLRARRLDLRARSGQWGRRGARELDLALRRRLPGTSLGGTTLASSGAPDAWERLEDTGAAPLGTRSALVALEAVRSGGAAFTAHFDDVVLARARGLSAG
jgi:hypothetical protein